MGKALALGEPRAFPALPVDAQLELARLEQEFGGRQHLVQALTFAKQTKDIRYVLGLIADPENRSLSLADICRQGRILPGELITALAAGTELRSQLLARQHIAQRIPTVVAEVMKQAAEYEDDCTDCMGSGKVTPDPTPDAVNPEPVDCRPCLGTGRLRYPADGKCRDLALEMGGLTSKGGGISVSTSVNVAAVSGAYEGFERMQEAMDRILYGDASGVPEVSPAVDAVVVVPEAADPATPEEPAP